MSVVFYKFKSQKEPSRITFDGTGISVFDLKREIILENKMGKGTDFDFALYNPDTEDEYSNDYAIIPRSTSVLARRLPPAKPGRGNGADYIADSVTSAKVPAAASSNSYNSNNNRGQYNSGGGGGGGGGGRRFEDRSGTSSAGRGMNGHSGAPQTEQQATPREYVAPAAAQGDEAASIAAMFAATGQQWQATQDEMQNANYVNFKGQPRPRPANGAGGAGGFERRQFDSHKPPPPGYICYRCGQKGHWIQDCPTNADKEYDNRPKIKRTTGIPKSFLTTVEGPGGASDENAGLMVTTEGEFVVAKHDTDSWNAHRAITKNLTASDVQNLAPSDPDLTCPLDSRLLREAVLTPCCSTSFCKDCVSNFLFDNDFSCPECESRIKSADKLIPDEGRRERVQRYIDATVEASKAEAAALELDDEGLLEEGEQMEVDAPKTVKEEEGTGQVPSKTESAAGDAPRSERGMSGAPSASPEAKKAGGVMDAAQQQQQMMMRQQQMMMQQAAMMQSGMGGMNPAMLQQQIYQLNMMVHNPQLPPQQRMMFMQQLQYLTGVLQQVTFQQQQQQRNFPGRRNPAIANAYGGHLAGSAPRPTGNGAAPPTGPAAGPSRPAVARRPSYPDEGNTPRAKRPRSEDMSPGRPPIVERPTIKQEDTPFRSPDRGASQKPDPTPTRPTADSSSLGERYSPKSEPKSASPVPPRAPLPQRSPEADRQPRSDSPAISMRARSPSQALSLASGRGRSRSRSLTPKPIRQAPPEAAQRAPLPPRRSPSPRQRSPPRRPQQAQPPTRPRSPPPPLRRRSPPPVRRPSPPPPRQRSVTPAERTRVSLNHRRSRSPPARREPVGRAQSPPTPPPPRHQRSPVRHEGRGWEPARREPDRRAPVAPIATETRDPVRRRSRSPPPRKDARDVVDRDGRRSRSPSRHESERSYRRDRSPPRRDPNLTEQASSRRESGSSRHDHTSSRSSHREHSRRESATSSRHESSARHESSSRHNPPASRHENGSHASRRPSTSSRTEREGGGREGERAPYERASWERASSRTADKPEKPERQPEKHRERSSGGREGERAVYVRAHETPAAPPSLTIRRVSASRVPELPDAPAGFPVRGAREWDREEEKDTRREAVVPPSPEKKVIAFGVKGAALRNRRPSDEDGDLLADSRARDTGSRIRGWQD